MLVKSKLVMLPDEGNSTDVTDTDTEVRTFVVRLLRQSMPNTS